MQISPELLLAKEETKIMQIVALVPARFASTRFPGKPLALLKGKPLVQWVCEGTARCSLVDRVIVATDDERIAEAVAGFGGEAVMTRADHPSGTDRLAEAASGLDADLVVNVQGDEPLVMPEMIEQALAPLIADPAIPMGTLKNPIENEEDLHNPNIVKVVTDLAGFALYFSRAPIPCRREGGAIRAWRHVGLYVYRRDFLLKFARLAPTPLENLEKLEQLRALEHGYKIMVAETPFTSHGVDTPQDLERVAAMMG